MTDTRAQLIAKGRAAWKAEQKALRIRLILRWTIAVPCMVFSYPHLGLIGPFVMLFGAILIAPDLAGFIAGLLGDMFSPNRSEAPPPLYDIPEALAAKGQYAEAEDEYEKIIEAFPKETKPHIDMINIAVTRMNDRALAEELYNRGIDILEDPDAQQQLTTMYRAILTRLKKD
jgi:tetratricopeptide (TPR) repeat protein